MPNITGITGGKSDSVGKVNLATNGSFTINQRQNFSSLTSCKANDYIADCWQVYSTNIDYCEAICPIHSGLLDNTLSYGYIQFKGYGKRGQILKLNNIDYLPIGYSSRIHYHSSLVTPFTAAVDCIVGTAYNEYITDVKVTCFPRSYSSSKITILSSPQIVGRGRCMTQEDDGHISRQPSKTIINTRTDLIDTAGYIEIELLSDGEFYLTLSNYREFTGGFIHPSRDCQISYSEELTRCEKYYQIGSFKATWAADDYIYIPFRTKMAGTPTPVITQTAGSGTLTYTNNTNSGFSVKNTGAEDGEITWTAEV